MIKVKYDTIFGCIGWTFKKPIRQFTPGHQFDKFGRSKKRKIKL